MENRSDRGPGYGVGAVLLLLALFPSAWPMGIPVALALVAALGWIGPLHRLGLTRPTSLTALALAILGVALPEPESPSTLDRIDPILEDVVLRCVEDAEWVASDPWLRESVATGSRIAAFEHLDALMPPATRDDAVGAVVRAADGELVAWAGWTPAAYGGRGESIPEEGTKIAVWLDEPYTLVRAVAPIEGGGAVVVGRPLAVVEPLLRGGIRPAVPPVEGLRFHDTLVTYDPNAIAVDLDGGTGTPLATLNVPPSAPPLPGGARRVGVLAVGLIASLCLAIPPLRRRDGLRGWMLGCGILFVARFLLLDVPILGEAARDPAEFAVLLSSELPAGLATILASPGDAALTFLALNLALALAFRNSSRWIRRRDRALPALLALPAAGLTVVAAVLWTEWTAAFAEAAGHPPFVDLTTLGDPAVLSVAVSVVLLGSAFVMTTAGCGVVFLSALPGATRRRLPRLVPAALVALACAPLSSAGWLLAATTAALTGSANAFVRRRSVVGPWLVAVVVLIGLASAAVLKEQQRKDFQFFAEEQARRWSHQREGYELSILESAVSDMLADGRIQRVIEGTAARGQAAFHAWLASGLSGGRRPCRIEILDPEGRLLSRFRVDMPGTLGLVSIGSPATAAGEEISVRRVLRKIGSREWEMLVATAPIETSVGEGRLSVTILPDGPALVGTGTGELSRRLSRWGADPVVLRYRNGVLVDSNAPDAPIGDLLPEETRGLFTGGGALPGGWRDAMLGDRAYRLHWSLQPSGEVLGLGLPVGPHPDLAALALDAVAVHGCVLFAFWLLIALAGGWARRIPHLLGQFRVRLMLAIVAVAVFPIVFWGTAGVQQLTRERDDALRTDLEHQASLALGALELDLELELARSLLQESEALVDWLAAGAEAPAPWGMVEGELPAGTNGQPRLAGSRIYDASGIERARSGRTASVPWEVLNSVLENGESRTFYQELDGEPALVLVSPLPARDGRLTGCTVGYRALGRQTCERLHALVLNEVRVYGREGLAGTSRPELVAARLVPELLPSKVWRALLGRGRPGLITSELESLGERLTVFRALRLDDVIVVGALAVSLPHSGQLGESREAARSISLIISLSLVWLGLAVSAGLILSRRISDPLQRLIHGTARISAGALGEEVEVQGRDELARLVTAFNRMSRSLAENRDELEAQRSALEAIIEHLEAGVVSADAGGRIRLSNRAAHTLLGQGRPLVGGIEAALGRSDLTGVDALIEAFRRTGAVSKEIPFGEDSTLRVSLTRIGDSGPGGRVLLVAEDLTDLIQSQRMLAWAQMARQVAHEIKNPLTPMKLQAQNLLYAYDDDRRSEDFGRTLRESVGVIVEQIERLRRISGEFSRMARPETVGRSAIDLGDAVSDALRIYEGASEQVVDLSVKVEAKTAPVRIAREDVARLVLNLVENARDAMAAQGGGQVRVEVRSTEIGGEVSGVELRVSDDGPGISPEVRQKLFEPYFSTKTSGTGLGLSIVKKIVDECGGRILVEPALERGTVFRVLLPAATAPVRSGGEPLRRPDSRDDR
ncbi:MAG: hypothetical protein CME06_16310 [Gemmatimonadetes bacterium]|nr:hypothetical protein [Gemmatimonadota bacterium]